MRIWKNILTVLVVGSLTLGVAFTQEAKDAAKGEAHKVSSDIVTGKAYPLATCAACDKKMADVGKPVEQEIKGHWMQFCCKDCAAKVEKEPAAAVKKVEDAVIAQQKSTYPLDACPISGKKLGDGAVSTVIGNRLVKTCCKNCVPAVQKDVAGTMKKIDTAVVASQKDKYPLKTCIISGHELTSMGKPTMYVHGTRLVEFCCEDCIKDFEKDSATFLAKLDEASKKN